MVAGAVWSFCGHPLAAATTDKPIAVIYGTDLFHPYDDPDDHFDLATLFSLKGLEVKAILLDLGDRQKVRPGRVPLEQMFRLTGKRVPYATGLSAPLRSRDDKGMDRPPDEQKAIGLLLDTLRQAGEPVTLITAGSLRDVCAAFNRDADLFRAKVNRLYINIGSATDTSEWNVQLDLHAYLSIMHSGLPVYWSPCEPIKPHPHSTYWKFQQSRMLEGLPTPVLNYFVYALQRVRTDELDPQTALDSDLRVWRQLPGRDDRNMWCTASLLDAAGCSPQKAGGFFRPLPASANETDPVFKYVPVTVELDDRGRTRAIHEDPKGNIRVFTTANKERYQSAMTECLRWLLMNLEKR